MVGIEELWLPNTARGPAAIFEMETLPPLHTLKAWSLLSLKKVAGSQKAFTSLFWKMRGLDQVIVSQPFIFSSFWLLYFERFCPPNYFYNYVFLK